MQLIGSLLDETEGITIAEATKEALSRLEGTWGIVLIDVNDPNQIIAARLFFVCKCFKLRFSIKRYI